MFKTSIITGKMRTNTRNNKGSLHSQRRDKTEKIKESVWMIIVV